MARDNKTQCSKCSARTTTHTTPVFSNIEFQQNKTMQKRRKNERRLLCRPSRCHFFTSRDLLNDHHCKPDVPACSIRTMAWYHPLIVDDSYSHLHKAPLCYYVSTFHYTELDHEHANFTALAILFPSPTRTIAQSVLVNIKPSSSTHTSVSC